MKTNYHDTILLLKNLGNIIWVSYELYTHIYKKWMLGLRLSWEDEREKHNSWKRSVPQARGRFHELCFSLSSSHESRKPNIHFL